MAANTTPNGSPLVVVNDIGGITVIDPSTLLKRLNYFDGKFLRAADLELEQGYLRNLVALSNQGLGAGIVYGYDTVLGQGDDLRIGPGLAIDPAGKVLLLQSAVTQNIQALIEASKKTAPKPADASGKTGGDAFSDCVQTAAPPPTNVVPVSDLYVITICAAEALCGQEDVYGIACQDACVTAQDRPYRIDGVVLRALPLQLVTPFPTSKAVAIDASLFLRSKVAHSWFADEVRKHPDAISRDGLLSGTWCLGAGYDHGCCEVPLAVVARAGATTLFLDAWIVRRERIDAPAKRYWQWKMRMRPWDVFLAQILQFQCQLAGLLAGVKTPGDLGNNPCAAYAQTLNEAAQFVAQVQAGLADYRSLTANASLSGQPALLSLSLTQIADLRAKLLAVLKTQAPTQAKDRILIRGGIIELPSAGYLPVLTGASVSVNAQVRALLGEGLDLCFCATTADCIAHALEEAQHRERISLLQGIDDPTDKPKVDILVPDGVFAQAKTPASGSFYRATLNFGSEQTGSLAYKGAARQETLASGGTALYAAGAGLSQAVVANVQGIAKSFASQAAKTVEFNASPAETQAYAEKASAMGTQFDAVVANAASSAQNANTFGLTQNYAPLNNSVSQSGDSVDGLWLAHRCEQSVQALGVNGQTPVSLRVVISSQAATPLAVELSFNGTLTINTVASALAGPVLTGKLNGLVSVGILSENQAQQATTEFLTTERVNWPVKLSYADDNLASTCGLDISLGNATGTVLRVVKSTSPDTGNIAYQIAWLASSTAQAANLGHFMLLADASVALPNHPSHVNAEHGLDFAQAALIVSEPAFKADAEALLFPSPSVAAQASIQAVRDWVLFTRRRERHCVADAQPVPPPPPRRYHVLNLTLSDAEKAQRFAEAFASAAPDKLAQEIKLLLAVEKRQDHLSLVVTFDGGKATAQSDLTAAADDWQSFKPGGTIAFAAAGALGETDAALQLKRIDTFEAAISPYSQEPSGLAPKVAIIPYPQEVVPPDADGVMLFVTLAEQIHAYAAYATSEVFKVYSAHLDKQPLADGELLDLPSKKGVTDLGRVGLGENATVDDQQVVGTYKASVGNPVTQSLLLVRGGDSDAANAQRLKAATQIVADLGGADPKLYVYDGTWPFTDAQSLLLVEADNTLDVPR